MELIKINQVNDSLAEIVAPFRVELRSYKISTVFLRAAKHRAFVEGEERT